MTVFPVPATSFMRDRFSFNVDAVNHPGTIEVDVFPMYVTDRGHVVMDHFQNLAHVSVPDATEWGGDIWFDTGLTSTPGELADLPHDAQQAVDAALAQARLKLQKLRSE